MAKGKFERTRIRRGNTLVRNLVRGMYAQGTRIAAGNYYLSRLSEEYVEVLREQREKDELKMGSLSEWVMDEPCMVGREYNHNAYLVGSISYYIDGVACDANLAEAYDIRVVVAMLEHRTTVERYRNEEDVNLQSLLADINLYGSMFCLKEPVVYKDGQWMSGQIREWRDKYLSDTLTIREMGLVRRSIEYAESRNQYN